MSIDQKRTSLGIFKRGSFNTEVDYKDIHDIVLKTTFDKGNLFLIIISTIISIIFTIAKSKKITFLQS